MFNKKGEGSKPMMNCDKAKILLSDYIDGMLEPGVKKEIEVFLESDPDCKSLFEESMSIQKKLTHLPQVSPSPDFDSNLRNKIIELNNNEKMPASRAKGLSLVFSGTVLVVSLYLFIFTDIGTQQNSPEGPIPSSAIGSPGPGNYNDESSNEPFVNSQEDETKMDSLKTIPEKINSNNIHLTGDK